MVARRGNCCRYGLLEEIRNIPTIFRRLNRTFPPDRVPSAVIWYAQLPKSRFNVCRHSCRRQIIIVNHVVRWPKGLDITCLHAVQVMKDMGRLLVLNRLATRQAAMSFCVSRARALSLHRRCYGKEKTSQASVTDDGVNTRARAPALLGLNPTWVIAGVIGVTHRHTVGRLDL